MKKTVIVNSQPVEFIFNEGGNSWSSKLAIDKFEIEIEINFNFHKNPSIDWDHLVNFIHFISVKDRLTELTSQCYPLITELGKVFYKRIVEIKEWNMVFRNSIFYNGHIEGTLFTFSFSLLFDFISGKKNVIEGDEYGLYLVDLESLQIIGARRHPC